MPNIDNDTIQALKEIAKDKSIFRRNLKLQELVNAKKANKENTPKTEPKAYIREAQKRFLFYET